MNILVEDWGGKYQCQEISAKTELKDWRFIRENIIRGRIVELKANPNRTADRYCC